MARKRVKLAGLELLFLDLRDAWRSLLRYPLAAGVAIVSLAAGIGGTTATLIARDVMFLSPPPLYHEPDQLSRVTMATPDRPIGAVPGALVATWQSSHVAGLAATAHRHRHPADGGGRLQRAVVRGRATGT
jgi:hypothetical protein